MQPPNGKTITKVPRRECRRTWYAVDAKLNHRLVSERPRRNLLETKKLSLTGDIAGFKDKIYKRRLEADLYWVYISIAPRGLVLNSRHWDLSKEVFMAPSLFAFHQSFSSWEGLAAQFLSVSNICWNDFPFQKPKKKNH